MARRDGQVPRFAQREAARASWLSERNTWSKAGSHPAAPLETSHGAPRAAPPTAHCTALDGMPTTCASRQSRRQLGGPAAHGEPGPGRAVGQARADQRSRFVAFAALGHAQGDAGSMVRSWVRGSEGCSLRGWGEPAWHRNKGLGPGAMRRTPRGRGDGGLTSGLLGDSHCCGTTCARLTLSVGDACRESADSLQALCKAYARGARPWKLVLLVPVTAPFPQAQSERTAPLLRRTLARLVNRSAKKVVTSTWDPGQRP